MSRERRCFYYYSCQNAQLQLLASRGMWGRPVPFAVLLYAARAAQRGESIDVRISPLDFIRQNTDTMCFGTTHTSLTFNAVRTPFP